MDMVIDQRPFEYFMSMFKPDAGGPGLNAESMEARLTLEDGRTNLVAN